MNPEYLKHIALARRHKKENKKVLNKIRARRKSGLDQEIQYRHEQAFEKIDCLQCANCCKTTGPLLLNKDIDRLAGALKQRPADFTEKFLRIDEDRDYVFKAMPCPFLKDDNCCSVYESRPNACREYPHTQQRDQLQKLNLTYENSLICPAVALIVNGLREEGFADR